MEKECSRPAHGGRPSPYGGCSFGGDQGEPDDGAAAAAEDVGRLAAETDTGALRARLKLMFEQPG